MKYIITIFTVLFCSGIIMASNVSGRVCNQEGEPLSGATCACISLPDSTFFDAVISDSNGVFSIPTPDQDWYLDITNIGYNPYQLTKTEYLKQNKDIVDIILEPRTTNLQEFTITADNGIMTMKNGIMSYNNLNTIIETQAVTSAHDLLLALPLITTDNGDDIKLTGAPLGSVIYINGRQSNMDMTMLINYLKSMPPKMVKSVDIIYHPTPNWKTDKAVINVTVKQQDAYTFNGQIRGGGSWRQYLSGYAASTIFAGLPKTNIVAGYTFSASKSKSKYEYLSRHTVESTTTDIDNESTTKSVSDSHNVFLMADYSINSNNTLSVNYSGQFVPKSYSGSDNINSAFGRYTSKDESRNTFNNLSAVYTHSKGITAGIDYSHYTAEKDINMDNLNGDSKEILGGTQTQGVDNIKTYLDFITTLKSGWNLFCGASYETSRNTSAINIVSKDPTLSGEITDTQTGEHQTHGYFGAAKSVFNNTLSLAAYMKGEVYRFGDYSHNQLLPFATVTYALSNSHIFQLQYQTLKQYPSFWQKQEYKTYYTPYLVGMGNPALKPSTSYYTNLIYLLRQKYTFGVSHSYTKDYILNQLYQSDKELLLVSQPFNIDYTQSMQAYVSIPLHVGKLLNSTITPFLTYARYKSSDWHNLSFDRRKLWGGASITNALTLSRQPKITLYLTGSYSMPHIAGMWDRDASWALNTRLSGSFFGDNLTVSLHGNDLLASATPKEKIHMGTQWYETNSNFYTRSFALSIAWNFRGYKERNIKQYDSSRYGIQ